MHDRSCGSTADRQGGFALALVLSTLSAHTQASQLAGDTTFSLAGYLPFSSWASWFRRPSQHEVSSELASWAPTPSVVRRRAVRTLRLRGL
jgi:hypothetical protein